MPMFNSEYEDGKKIILLTPNMTLRDYFAGQALVGLTIDKEYFQNTGWPEKIARAVYLVADSMLAERGSGLYPIREGL